MKNWLVYLISLSGEALSQKESEVLTNILDSSRDLERIGDHAEALLNLNDYLQRKNVQFSEAALEELAEIYLKLVISSKMLLRVWKTTTSRKLKLLSSDTKTSTTWNVSFVRLTSNV